MKKLKDASGQMTVEMAVVFPVLLMLAFIGVNALTFMGDCARFDECARSAIRMQADDGLQGSQGCAEVRQRILDWCDDGSADVAVSCEKIGLGHVRYKAEIFMGIPLLKGVSVFGLQVPRIKHEMFLTVSPYRKGVVA